MIFKRLLLGEGLCFDADDKLQLTRFIKSEAESEDEKISKNKVLNALQALSICHNVTPVIDN